MSSWLSFIRLDQEPDHVNFAMSLLGYNCRDDVSDVFDTELKSSTMLSHRLVTDMRK